MALVKGINSFADVFEFDLLFADRLDVSAAVTAAAATKAAALITATDILNELHWAGVVSNSNQELAFPRSGSYFDPRLGGRVYLDGTTIPARITKATLFLAYHLLTNEGLQDSTGKVIDLEVGSIHLTRIVAPSVIPLKVKTIIKPLLVNSGANSWYRAN